MASANGLGSARDSAGLEVSSSCSADARDSERTEPDDSLRRIAMGTSSKKSFLDRLLDGIISSSGSSTVPAIDLLLSMFCCALSSSSFLTMPSSSSSS